MLIVIIITVINVDLLFRKAIIIFLAILLLFCLFYIFFTLIEGFYVDYIRPKPLFNHIYLKKVKLSQEQRYILVTKFSFYNKLSPKEQGYFEHRVAIFLKHHDFVGKSGLMINPTKQILIASTAIMLTFGYRNYNIACVKRFIIYPDVFYSNTNNAYHKGEFNPSYKAIALSWKDFINGYEITNDNFNLGIHEYVHAMHFQFLKTNSRSVTSTIFIGAYEELKSFLKKNDDYRNHLVASKYLRNYAFTNQFEFIAVLIESFIETPEGIKSLFPEMYNYIKQMLNFDFAGY